MPAVLESQKRWTTHAPISGYMSPMRHTNEKRVDIKLAPKPAPFGCRDFYVDNKWVGGMFLTDSDYSRFLYSEAFKSTVCILLQNGFSWDEVLNFTGITLENESHLQLRQVELIHSLVTNEKIAHVYYGTLYRAAAELAEKFLDKDIDVTSIFLAGGSAMLLDPTRFPLQTNPKARVKHRISKPKTRPTPQELAETLVDIDVIVFGANINGHDLTEILGCTYGTYFVPLGKEPEKIITNFPNKMGLDVIVCEKDNLAEMISSAVESSDIKTPVTLVRYPNTHKSAQSRLAPGLITEMIPLWWNFNKPFIKEDFYSVLSNLARRGNIDLFLEGCSRASQAREILYADPEVKTALQVRWEMTKDGVFMEDLFKKRFETNI